MAVIIHKGKRYFEVDGKRYLIGGQAFEKVVNQKRRAGIRLFDRLVVDGVEVVINPKVSGKGSRDVFVPLSFTAKGKLTKQSEKVKNEIEKIWENRKIDSQLIKKVVLSGKTPEDAVYGLFKDVGTTGSEVRFMITNKDFDKTFVIPNNYKEFRLHFVEGSDGWFAEPGDVVLLLRPSNVAARVLRQRFRDGVDHCVFTPIIKKLTKLMEGSKSTDCKKRYAQRIACMNDMEQTYILGVPEDDMEQVAKTSGLKITLVNVFGQTVRVYNEKGRIGSMLFCNTRDDHVEEGGIVLTSEFTVLSVDEMTALWNRVRKERMFYHVEGDFINGLPSRIVMLDGAFKLYSEEKDVFAEFNEKIGIETFGLDAIKYPEVNDFIKSARIINATPAMLDEGEATGLLDMPSAYAQFRLCDYYRGFMGKVQQWRSGDFDRAWIAEYIGIYRAHIHSCDDIMLMQLGICPGKTVILPSVELLFLMDSGVEMTVDCGVWGSKFDFSFTDEMLVDRRYTRWSGMLGCERREKTYTFPATKRFTEHLKATTPYNVMYWDSQKMAVVKVPKSKLYTKHHILAFITSYVRIQMIQAMRKFAPGQVKKVVLDGIYYSGEAPTLDNFREKKVEAQHSYFAEWYDNVNSSVSFPPVQYSKNTLITGQGGCGKTYGILTNGGYNDMLYVAPTHVLGYGMRKKHGCSYTTINKLIGEQCRSFKEEQFYPSVIVLDELTQIHGAWVNKAISMYPHSLFLICGDIDSDGMPYQTRNGEGDEFCPIWKPHNVDIVCITGDRRSQCEKLKKEKLVIRKAMRSYYDMTQDDAELNVLINAFCRERYDTQAVSFEDAVKMFAEGDCWIAGTHKTNAALIDAGVVSGYYKKGGYISKEEKEGFTKRGSFTIHSFQGSTLESGKCFISMNDLFEFSMFYTAISRCVRWEQVVLVK